MSKTEWAIAVITTTGTLSVADEDGMPEHDARRLAAQAPLLTITVLRADLMRVVIEHQTPLVYSVPPALGWTLADCGWSLTNVLKAVEENGGEHR